MLDPNGDTPATRPSGWYWDRPKLTPSNGDQCQWVPAYFNEKFFTWCSVNFYGLPDTGLAEIGDRIAEYHTRSRSSACTAT